MTSPELHADDLLDREIRGLLTREEHVRLDEHLAVCSVCRFERSVRADFRAEFESLGPMRSRGLAEKERTTRARGGTIRRARVRLLGLVAVLLFGGVAAAELSGVRLLSYVSWSSSPAPRAAPAASVVERVKQQRAKPSANAVPSGAASEAEVPPAPAAVLIRDEVGGRAPTDVVATAAKGAPPAMPVASASALFDEARVAREQGAYDLAVERYERLLVLFPSSPQALTTRAVLGRLLLDRGRAEAALGHFDAYLSSGASTLGEEAMLGRALAFGKLGQSMQEAEAWQALLRVYPSSVHAARARERLSVLPTP